VLDWGLRNDNRVVVMERTNAMHVELPELMDIISIDTSWTRQENIIPVALANLKPGGTIISLIKPHYEADKSELVKGKLQEEYIKKTLERVREQLSEFPIEIKDIIPSPILGKKGSNREYIMWIEKK